MLAPAWALAAAAGVGVFGAAAAFDLRPALAADSVDNLAALVATVQEARKQLEAVPALIEVNL